MTTDGWYRPDVITRRRMFAQMDLYILFTGIAAGFMKVVVRMPAKKIPQSTRVSYWHRATLCLYGYVCLNKI